MVTRVVEPFWEDPEFESKVKEGVISEKKSRVKYRIFLGICGILLFLAGWITWNIGLPAEGESGALGMNWKTFLFFSGIFVQFIISPYFAWSAISTGRLSMLIPKEMREYNRLSAALAGKEIHDHYWTVLNDPEHEHHKEIIRYKWMDKVRWKHRPNDFFGYVKYTKESGEETKGPILPKSYDLYWQSNFTEGKDGEIYFDKPKHPLKYVFTLSMILFLLSVLGITTNFIVMVVTMDWGMMNDLLKMTSPSLLLGSYIIWRNTDLWDIFFRREQKYENMSVPALEERLDLMRKKYVVIRDYEKQFEPESNETKYSRFHPIPLSFVAALLFTLSDGWETITEGATLFFGSFILLMLLQKHYRLRGLSMDSFSDYRISKKHIHLLDGLFSKKLKMSEIPQHSCVRIVDYWQWGNRKGQTKYNNCPQVCLHLIRVLREKPEIPYQMLKFLVKPGYKLNSWEPEYLDGQKDREEGVRYWFEEIKIRFEFKTKAEQEDFAERLAADLSLPIRKHWRFSEATDSKYLWPQ